MGNPKKRASREKKKKKQANIDKNKPAVSTIKRDLKNFTLTQQEVLDYSSKCDKYFVGILLAIAKEYQEALKGLYSEKAILSAKENNMGQKQIDEVIFATAFRNGGYDLINKVYVSIFIENLRSESKLGVSEIFRRNKELHNDTYDNKTIKAEEIYLKYIYEQYYRMRKLHKGLKSQDPNDYTEDDFEIGDGTTLESRINEIFSTKSPQNE